MPPPPLSWGRISAIVLATHARPSYAKALRKKPLQSMIPSDLAGGGTGFRLDHAQQTKRKRNAGRRVVQPPRLAGAAPPSEHPPSAREARRGARLSASHHGACGSEQTPQLSSSYALPGTELGRSGR